VTNLHLRQQVAEARGWTDVKACHPRELEGLPPDEVDADDDLVPAYEIDMNAAITLLDGLHWRLMVAGDKIMAIIDDHGVARLGDTIPEAICEAYLIHMEIESREPTT